MSTPMIAIPLTNYIELLESQRDLEGRLSMTQKVLLEEVERLQLQVDICGEEMRSLNAQILVLMKDLERERRFSDALQEECQDLAVALADVTCLGVP